MKELPKAFEPQQYEQGIYKKWEESGYFNPDICIEKGVADASAPYFSMVLPPPNVTGTLHMGHAAMLAIQDIMARYHRMKGERTLWVPGTDHAAVATESKVENLLIKEKGYTRPKEELGREAFLKEVHAFAQQSHDTIVNQSKRMGASLDWSREAYTLDEARNLAVRTVFKKMYDDGLIYRGYRVINWSVKGQSTCSDDELVYVDRPGKLYTFKYSKDFPITIATTRPETKLGDTAVAVHPTDERYAEYIGQTFTIDVGAAQPLSIKIIADEGVDPAFGTGALGVTPAHSATDFEMYQKQKAAGNEIGFIQVIGEDGKMTAEAGAQYEGLSVREAREKFVAYLSEQGLLEKEEEIMQSVGTSDRFSDVVEPLPKTQWFVDVNKKFKTQNSKLKGVQNGQEVSLKELMQQVVRENQITIVPDRFTATYFHWIDNLRDWNISRQIWFGHQVPAYFDINDEQNAHAKLHFLSGKVYRLTDNYFHAIDNKVNHAWGSIGQLKWVSFSLAKTLVENGTVSWEELKADVVGFNLREARLPSVYVDESEVPVSCIQDPDTLDTWFSSGLWTFSTLGWPDTDALDFKNYHPTSVLETGYDIIFFWVARMILMSTYVIGDVPFKTVYLHGLVRDEQGRKMSKSIGNIIDPLEMCDKYGTDATRLSLIMGTTPGNDTKLSEAKVEGLRNFSNKLWNISRFMLLNIEEPKKNIAFEELKLETLADRWILEYLDWMVYKVQESVETYNFSFAAELLRDFTWDKLADWYLEIAKVEGNKSDILNYILNTVLKLWHPYIPFVTEAIWKEMYGEGAILMVESWPSTSVSEETGIPVMKWGAQFDILRNVVTTLRGLRSENGIEPAKKVKVTLVSDEYQKGLDENAHVITSLARVESLTIVGDEKDKPEGAVGTMIDGIGVYIDLAGAVDVAAEKERLSKEIEKVEPYVVAQEKKLSNKEFVDNAPAPVVAGEQKKLEEAKAKLAVLKTQLERL